jgi:phage baseplate assembly protein gpV
VDDSELRYRVSVRVAGIDHDDAPENTLRFAEMVASFSSTLAADVPHYNVGEQVWVMFEGGDPDFPVVIGGWINSQFGFTGIPTAQATDYANTRLRWLRIDRVANQLVLSEVPEELWIQLISGAAQITVCQADNSVSLYAKSGLVDSQAARLSSTAGVADHNAQQFFLTSTAYTALGGANGLLRLISNLNLDLHCGPANGRINIGGYVPTFEGVTDASQPSMAPQQTAQVNLLGQVCNVGAADGDTQGLPPVQLQETEQSNVKGKSIKILAAPTTVNPYPSTPVAISIDAVSGNITITVTGGTITVQSDTKVTVEAPEVDVTATALVNVTAPSISLGS